MHFSRDSFTAHVPSGFERLAANKPFFMHARDLAELAAIVAVEAPGLIRRGARVPPRATEEYWAASKCRLDRWGRLLRQLAASAGEVEVPATLSWPRVEPVIEEVLASELLARLWAATACAYDVAHGDDELAPVAQNILMGHFESRLRVLTLLADSRVVSQLAAIRLNELRRRVERWNDMLLGHLAGLIDIEPFAFDPARARDFANDLDHESAHSDPRFTSQLVLASLRASFAEGLSARSPNADLNRRIASAVSSAVQSSNCESTGLVKSLWLERLTSTASEAEFMIEELVRLDRSVFP